MRLRYVNFILKIGKILRLVQKHLPECGMKRENIFITTKVPTINEDPTGWAHKHIKESLEKLKTE